ncbi:hypothetical protein CR203_06415 [Salipaludibacillus neizhouensis]|uniref:DNA-binding response regulator n=1 Tax=Salipaludibacillus neizhouensis TaxID=885475 RepID=A0A3A9K7B4_9BACI|nr:response regulator [Salipaludibacillus neizhouensis]RKL68119.1 hypothetical protein CR203_06415 [Salipaludibacillus neizhouensis]
MIRVLLVEDDKLVRKNLIASFNWEAFDMEVIGDAKHGEQALDFLEKQEVDLIITDLAMPIMSGTELIRKVKELYSKVYIVVLSLHREFDYIQEAMRLGAIDYIAKVELDSDNMDKTLQRIQDRIKNDSNTISSIGINDQTGIRKGNILITDQDIDKYQRALYQLESIENLNIFGLNSMYFEGNLPIEEQLSALISPNEQVLLVEIVSDHLIKWEELDNFFRRYKDSILFYEVEKRGELNTFVLNYNDFLIQKSSEEAIKKQKEELISLRWCHSNELLTQTLEDLKALKLTKNKLYELILLTMHECRRIYADILEIDIFSPINLDTWVVLENWFKETKEEINKKLFHTSLSDDTTASVLMAIQIIEKKLNTSITANEISKDVNMSRSYFSTCFKHVIGNTFNEYVRIARIRKAKNYLLYTNEKVSIIAEKVGYVDVKYFSKVFKKSTGSLPSQFRRNKVRV